MSERMILWHPESPGERVTVDVRWYRRPTARKWGFATLSESLREDRRRRREAERAARQAERDRTASDYTNTSRGI